MAYWKFSDCTKRCYSWQWWVDYIDDRNRVTLSPNTFVEKGCDGLIYFHLHGYNIMTLSNLNRWQISSCGWETHTTKKRINQLSPIHVYQRDWQWYYDDENNIRQEFHDDIIVDYTSQKQDSLCWTKLKL